MDLGTSKTAIHSFYGNRDLCYPTVIGYKEDGSYVVGHDAMNLAGAVDLIWIKEESRISKQQLQKHPLAYAHFVYSVLERLGLGEDNVDLMLSEPLLFTKAARKQIVDQLKTIKQIRRTYFLPETVATAFSEKLEGKYLIVDTGDGNTSVQGFNSLLRIEGSAQQTFRAGRTMTFKTQQVLNEFFDIKLGVENSSSPNFNYLKKLKEDILDMNFSGLDSGKKLGIIVRQSIENVLITPHIQREIIGCLFDDDRDTLPLHKVIKASAFSREEIASDILKTIILTGNSFRSVAVEDEVRKRLNELLALEKEALSIKEISVRKASNYTNSVVEGMKVMGESIQKESTKWINL